MSFRVEKLSKQSELLGFRLQSRVVKVAERTIKSREVFVYFVPQVLNKQGELLF